MVQARKTLLLKTLRRIEVFSAEGGRAWQIELSFAGNSMSSEVRRAFQVTMIDVLFGLLGPLYIFCKSVPPLLLYDQPSSAAMIII